MTTYSSFLETPAKINYDLHVVGRRSDGYHLLDSIFLPIEGLSDKVSVTCSEGEGVSLKVFGSDEIPCNSENLVWKAAEKIIELSGENISVDIELVKKIPVAAGLGGGSSDAAAILRLINNYLVKKGQGLSDSQLVTIASEIGADVPFFLKPQPALVTGIGENIVPIATTKDRWLLLISPDLKISAASAYEHYRASARNFSKVDRTIKLKNDLEEPVANKYIALIVLRDFIKKMPNVEHSAMSGSGASWFAIFDSEKDLLVAEKLLKNQFPKLSSFTSAIKVP